VKILVYARVFWPSVGGVETLMEVLAEEFVAAGHQVRIVTKTAIDGHQERKFNYEVFRTPTWLEFLQSLHWCDVCLCANVSLRGLGWILLSRKPFVVTHQGSYGSPNQLDLAETLKKIVTRFSNNICCSDAVKTSIPGKSIVIPNTYRDEIFKEYNDVVRDLDIVFVGRLVSDKGVADLLDALGHLGRLGLRPQLSIVGDGPERGALLRKTEELGLSSQVMFTGTKSGRDLARYIGRHRAMIVPSRWAEPFGIVALEGIACGCVVVGTDLGGLPEAIGPCGCTVPNGDAIAMAEALGLVLKDDLLLARYRSSTSVHLASHSRKVVSRGYLDVLEAVT
jgi:glycosyltransferase involved in cell wall biosynthesis